MIAVQSTHGPIAVSIPSSTHPRFIQFEQSLEGLMVPGRSMVARMSSGATSRNKNEEVRLVLNGDKKKKIEPRGDITHFFFQDDDHDFDQDLVLRLLEHGVPIVAAVTSYRMPPFAPVIYKDERIVRTLKDGRLVKHGVSYSWAELDTLRGLQPVFAVSGAGMLVAREVFETLDDPWFECGQYDPEEMGEDLYFYEKCRNAGYPIYVDLDTVQGHCGNVAFWPTRLDDGSWTIAVRFHSGDQIVLGRSDRRKIETASKVEG